MRGCNSLQSWYNYAVKIKFTGEIYMAQVLLDNVTKIFDGDVIAVDHASLDILDREFMVIVGPSGCGKTTTLRMIAGLEEVTDGTITIEDIVVNDVPPKNRDIAMVFQNYALYPHMTVFQNLAFGLKLRKFPKAEIRKRVGDTAALLNIGELLKRKPKALSGGQRQRVAVGRAIVRNPKAFLFDEPLSNLDAKLRVTMRVELKALHRRLNTTSIYVTHDQAEAMTLGDRICVMYAGRIQQVAPPMDVYDGPVNRFVAGFLGTPPMNFFDGRSQLVNGGVSFVGPDFQIGLLAKMKDPLAEYNDADVVLGVRPEGLTMTGIEGQQNNVITAVVTAIEPLGDRMEVHFAIETGQTFVANIDPHIRLEIDEKVRVFVDVEKVNIFEPGITGRNITLS